MSPRFAGHNLRKAMRQARNTERIAVTIQIELAMEAWLKAA
jgi:hypothetical protein